MHNILNIKYILNHDILNSYIEYESRILYIISKNFPLLEYYILYNFI